MHSELTDSSLLVFSMVFSLLGYKSRMAEQLMNRLINAVESLTSVNSNRLENATESRQREGGNCSQSVEDT